MTTSSSPTAVRRRNPTRGDLRGLRWLENPGADSDALLQPWTSHLIGRPGVEAMFSGSGDFDGDGDTDYVVPSIVTGEGDARDSERLPRADRPTGLGVIWYENPARRPHKRR
jgi:hypothetical protein